MNMKYKLCPQMRIYDNLKEEYIPNLMFTSNRNFRSEECNTDINGLRFNNNENLNKSISIFDQKKNNDSSDAIIVGGSTAFGVGASKDKYTLSNVLSDNNYNFYNLGGRAYNGFQELILYQANIEKLKEIKKIVIFSGLNDFYLMSYIKYQNNIGPIFFNKRFFEALKYSEINIIRKILHYYVKPFFLKEIDWSNISINELLKYLMSSEFRIEYQSKLNKFQKNLSIDNIVSRNLNLWNLLTKNSEIEIYYFLQPYFYWCKEPSKEEIKLFNYFRDNEKFWDGHDSINNYYSEYKKIVHDHCKKYSIKFFDCNEFIMQNHKSDWLFVDRGHLNDRGYNLIGKYIKNNL